MPHEQLTEAVRKIVHGVDPQQSIGNVGTMDERLNTAVAQPRLNMALLASFARDALLLACVGIYGVVAYSVAATSAGNRGAHGTGSDSTTDLAAVFTAHIDRCFDWARRRFDGCADVDEAAQKPVIRSVSQ